MTDRDGDIGPHLVDPSNKTPEAELEVIPESEMQRLEKENIVAALEHSNWKIYDPTGAAKQLGVKPTTLLSRMKKWPSGGLQGNQLSTVKNLPRLAGSELSD